MAVFVCSLVDLLSGCEAFVPTPAAPAMMSQRLIASDKSDSSSLSSEGEAVEFKKRDRSKSRSTAGSSSRTEKNKKLIRKLGTTLLDSNGESEDEEIHKLQKIIQDQAKELNEERQTSKKVESN